MKKMFYLFGIATINLITAAATHAVEGEDRLHNDGAGGSPIEYNNAYFKFQDGSRFIQQTYTLSVECQFSHQRKNLLYDS